jgi:AraC family transcriptional regulator of adaptative response/methylated-DNA-[protein]-cysteine methyltransferase
MENLYFGCSASPFGKCGIVFKESTVYGLAFIDAENNFNPEQLIKASFLQDAKQCDALAHKIFVSGEKVEIKLVGTDFQTAVWRELLKIPCGETRTYRQIARQAGRPAAVRAAANAVGDNRIAYLVPCHRVIRTDGGIGGYRWGIDVKKQILMRENIIIS